MTPGPVTPRMPVDAGAAQRQLTEVASETADAGSSFADLLAAMLSPGAAGVQLQAPASAPEEALFDRLDAAEIFNETGLFRGAAPLPSGQAAQGTAPPAVPAAIGTAATPVAAPQADLDSALSRSPDPAAPGADSVAAAAADGADSGGATQAGRPAGASGANGALPSLRGQAVAAAVIPAPSAAAAGSEPAAGGKVSARTTILVAQLMAAKTGAAAAQVSVQAIEGGISVMARVDRMSREERDRLRGEIGELLARHGFGSAEIMLNGEAWPLPQRKED